MAGDMADQLRERLEANRDAIGQIREEADRVGKGTGAIGGDASGTAPGGESDEERARREAQEAEIARLNRIAQIRIDAFEQEDEFLKAVLESEARRMEIESGRGTELEKRLAERGLKLALSDDALALLADVGFDPVYGARPLKRAIQQQLENPLAQRILSGEYASGDTIRVDAAGGQLVFHRG